MTTEPKGGKWRPTEKPSPIREKGEYRPGKTARDKKK